MREYLFAYGTLQAGLAPAEMVPVVAQLCSLGEGFLVGTLYDLGLFPGLVLHAAPAGRVFGTVYALPAVSGFLEVLDAYEEFDPASPGQSQFVRQLWPVTLVERGTVDCWVYTYNRDPGSAPVLRDGRYRGGAAPDPIAAEARP